MGCQSHRTRWLRRLELRAEDTRPIRLSIDDTRLPGCAGSFEQLVAQGAGRQELLGGAGKVSCSPELRAEPPVRSNASRLGYSAITMTSLATPTTGVQMVLTAQPLSSSLRTTRRRPSPTVRQSSARRKRTRSRMRTFPPPARLGLPGWCSSFAMARRGQLGTTLISAPCPARTRRGTMPR